MIHGNRGNTDRLLYAGEVAGLKKIYNTSFTDGASSFTMSLQEYSQFYTNFMIKLIDMLVNSNSTSTATGCVIRMEFSTDGGSTFKSGASDYSYQMIAASSASLFATGTSAASFFPIMPSTVNGLVAFNDQSYNCMLWINQPGETTERTQIKFEAGYHANGDLPVVITGYGAANVSEDTTHIKFNYSTGGTYDSGTVELWGIDRRFN